MPLIKRKSKKAFESNLKAEMHAGKPQDQALAIAYSVKRKAKKASGGSVESGSKDMNMAEGGAISAKSEKRPMPNDLHNDKLMASHNESKKKLIDSDWTDNPTVQQAQSNNGRMVKQIKQPRMVPSDAFSTRLRDEESDLQSSASPGPYGKQPPQHDNEDGPNRQGPDVHDMSDEHSTGKKPYKKEIEDQYAQDVASADMKRQQSYAKGGKVEASDYDRPMQQAEKHPDDLYRDEMHLQSSEAPSEDEGRSEANRRNEQGANRQGPAHKEQAPHSLASRMYHDDEDNIDDEMEMNPASGHPSEYRSYKQSDSPRDNDYYDDDGKESSIAAAIMSKKDREKANSDSGSRDLDDAVRMALGGELLEDDADIHSHGSTDSDDSDQADLSRNADEDANEEDQLSFDALRKENYSESEGLAQLDNPSDSGQKSDDEEMDSHDKRDMVSSIRRKMKSRKQF